MWRKLQPHERKFCVLKSCNDKQINPQKMCAACGTLTTDKIAFTFLVATQ
jgi:hypothetical protein